MSPEVPPVSRRDARLAEARKAQSTRSTIRGRRLRRVSRAGVISAIAIALPSAAVSGVALAAGNDFQLSPGTSMVADSGVTFSNGQGEVAFVLPGRPAGESLYLGLELRRTATALYRAKARVRPDGTLTVDIGRVSGGTEKFLGSRRLPAVMAAGGGTLHLQGAISGTSAATVSVRAWVGDAAVPAWQLSLADATPVTGTGSVRAWSYLSRSATAPIKLRYQALSGTPAGSAAPVATPPVASPSPATSSTVAPSAPAAEPAKPAEPARPASPAEVSTGMAAVLSGAGAAGSTSYPIPDGALFASPSGSNTNSGTAGSPLRTVAAAVAKAPAGGTVVLRGGTYREAAGSVNKKLSIQAYPGEKPVISGADVATGWSASGGAWKSSWSSPFAQNQFRAEEVKAGSAAGRVEQVFRNGTPLTQVVDRADLRSGRFWLDPSSLQAYVADDPSGATMEISTRVRGMTLEAGAAGSKILGLRFTAFAAPHLDNSGGLYVSAPNSLLQNSTFDHSSGAGLKIAATNLTVDRITVRDNAAEGMQGNRNDGSVVRDSLFEDNNTDDFKTWQCGASCTVAGFKTAHTDGLKVVGNAFVDNNSNGFWCDLGCTGVTVAGNAVTGSYDGIFYEVSSTGTITGNYVEKSDKGIRVSGSDHVTISNNTLVNNNWQLTVYDDRRSPSSDAYSNGKGLSWNTTDLVIRDNTITGGARTTKLLEANATAQVASPQMYKQLAGNTVSGTQLMLWCPADGRCTGYPNISSWKSVSGLGF